MTGLFFLKRRSLGELSDMSLVAIATSKTVDRSLQLMDNPVLYHRQILFEEAVIGTGIIWT